MLLQWPKDNGRGSSSVSNKRPFAVDYNDPKQPIRVFFDSAEDVDNLHTLMEASKLIIGGTSLYAKLTLIRARSEFKLRDAKRIHTTIQAAKREAPEVQEGILVKAQVTVKHGWRCRPTQYEMGKELAKAMGGTASGIYAVLSAGDCSGARTQIGGSHG